MFVADRHGILSSDVHSSSWSHTLARRFLMKVASLVVDVEQQGVGPSAVPVLKVLKRQVDEAGRKVNEYERKGSGKAWLAVRNSETVRTAQPL